MMKNKKIIAIILMFMINFLIYVPLLYASTYEYPLTKKTNSNNENSGDNKESSSIQTEAPVVPEFSFQSQSQILMELSTGKIIYENNADEHLFPASVTKIMSLILIMEQIDSGKLKYTDKVTCSAYASKMGGSQIWFKEGESLSIDDALKCICVGSANDVTVAMAELIAGSEQNFVKMMNNKAKQLELKNTLFENPHGIDDDITIDQHFTCARDIAIMSRELLLKHPGIIKYTSIWMDSIRDGSFGLTNTNKLVRFYEGTIGLKTGSTSKAGFNVSEVAKRENTTFIAVIMKAPSSDIRNEEAKQLLNYAFANYETKKIYDKDTKIDQININKYINSKVDVKIENEISVLINKGEDIETINEIKYNDNIQAPIKKGSVIGKLIIKNKANNQEVANCNLVIDKDINKSTLGEYYKYMIKRFTMRV